MIHEEGATIRVGEDLVSDCSFSRNTPGGYRDYHHKMTTYIHMVGETATAIDPSATARTYKAAVLDDDEDDPFHYMDTASARAGLTAAREKLKLGKVAIVGLGGSGSYLLDFIAKTPVREIHLFDGDRFQQHNAFRSPGAPSVEQMEGGPLKVDHFTGIYSKMRSGIIPHPYYVNEANIAELHQMDWVFIAADDAEAVRFIAFDLAETGVSFISVGMGLQEVDATIDGTLRVTVSTPEKRNHLDECLPRGSSDDNVYSQNVQVAELNALNAVMAVNAWKKAIGYYGEYEGLAHEVHFMVGANVMINGERDPDDRSGEIDAEAA